MTPLDRLEVERLRALKADRASHQRLDQGHVDDAVGQGDRALHDVLQLPHIAGIIVRQQEVQRRPVELRQLDRLPLAEPFGEVADQVRNVPPPLP